MRTYHHRIMISEFLPRRYVNITPFFSRRKDHTNFSGYVLISSNMMRWNCSKISILAVTAVLASELHSLILLNFHVDATSFHVLMHLIWIVWWEGNQIVLRSPYLLWAPWSIPWYRLMFVSTSHRFFSHSRKDSVRFLRWYIWCYGRIALRFHTCCHRGPRRQRHFPTMSYPHMGRDWLRVTTCCKDEIWPIRGPWDAAHLVFGGPGTEETGNGPCATGYHIEGFEGWGGCITRGMRVTT